jgi:mannose-6-phosphate isomerase-like protein (cupin superfamily)
MSDAAGILMLRTVPLGTYRFRAEREAFVSLEKEVTIRAGAAPIEMALSPAPPPPKAEEPPPPPPPPAAVEPAPVRPGEPQVISLLDVAEDSLGGKEPVRFVPVACSGLSQARLLVVRDTLPAETRPDADDMLYVIAGEATLMLAGKTQTITSGFFTVVPRGTSRTITRRGKNPAILLSIVGGPACGEPAPQ